LSSARRRLRLGESQAACCLVLDTSGFASNQQHHEQLLSHEVGADHKPPPHALAPRVEATRRLQ